MVIIMAILVLVTLLALAHAAVNCPVYTCESLDSNVCSTYTASPATFKINSSGCQSDYYCSAPVTVAWAKTLQISSATNTPNPCLPATTTTTSTTTTTTHTCIAKDSQKSFKNQATKIDCSEHSDCNLVDGTLGVCTCVIGTTDRGICKPHESNGEVFSGYWTDCGTENTLDEDEWAYWSYYKSSWEYTHSSVSCKDIFFESIMLSDLLDAKDGAATLAVGVLGLLALY